MKFDFSGVPLTGRGYSERPMMFLDEGPSAALAAILELSLIETGKRSARERWQKAQLRNLLAHATQRSAFWRDRMHMRALDSKLSAFPVLSRSDLRRQVELEGSLLRPSDGYQSIEYATSGSSGKPVRFFVSNMNSRYNSARALMHMLSEGEDSSRNFTAIRTVRAKSKEAKESRYGFLVEKKPAALGALASIFASGSQKFIDYLDPDIPALIKELRKDPVGYLVMSPGGLAMLLSRYDATLLRQLKVSECTLYGESGDPALVQAVRDQGIPLRSSYSAEEVGQIAFECATCPGHYHVTTSNVIVEVVDVSHNVGGTKLGRVLVTHLHSYATPFIRYDLGDLALLSDTCPCGHDGPTIFKLHGRASAALKRRDGILHPFYIRGSEFQKVVEFSEFRIRQVEIDRIVVEFGGREQLSPAEVENAIQFLKARSGDEFRIDVIARPAIDWGESIKRQSFRCEV
jgi:phenylacetate-coenzyme A ligase PaaK-like adenylate-forming protein